MKKQIRVMSGNHKEQKYVKEIGPLLPIYGPRQKSDGKMVQDIKR